MAQNCEVANYKSIYLCKYFAPKYIYHKRVEEHSFIYVKTGELKLNYNNKEYIIGENECVFVKRSHEVQYTKMSKGDTPFSGVFFVLDRLFLEDHIDAYRSNKNGKISNPIVKIEKTPLTNLFFSTFLDYMDNGIVPTDMIIDAKKVEGLYTLLQVKPELADDLFDFKKDNRIDLEYFMEKNFKENMTLEEFAHYTCRSLATFKREFKSIFNETPHKWILNRKLEEVKKAIENGRKASEVYLDLGFNSLQHLSSSFKKKFGVGLRVE